MSGIGGVLMFGGAPVSRNLLTALGQYLDAHGPDGGRDVIAGHLGMAYRAFHTNAESRREWQPYTADPEAMLCWDGRLDNRTDLLRTLRGDLCADDTDVAIVTAACLRYQRAGIAMLVGDFAFALWHQPDRSLWLARDCVGTRSLYFHSDSERVIWSTDLGAVVELSGINPRVDDEYARGFLAGAPEPGRTPFVAIRAVQQAHVVRIDRHGAVTEEPFWELDWEKKILYRTDAEYEEHFRSLFRDAVRARLRSDRVVLSELSGGLDSSSIVCMADRLIRGGEAEAPRLDSISYVFEGAPSSDERKWIDVVESHRQTRGYHISDREAPFLAVPPQVW